MKKSLRFSVFANYGPKKGVFFLMFLHSFVTLYPKPVKIMILMEIRPQRGEQTIFYRFPTFCSHLLKDLI